MRSFNIHSVDGGDRFSHCHLPAAVARINHYWGVQALQGKGQGKEHTHTDTLTLTQGQPTGDASAGSEAAGGLCRHVLQPAAGAAVGREGLREGDARGGCVDALPGALPVSLQVDCEVARMAATLRP